MPRKADNAAQTVPREIRVIDHFHPKFAKPASVLEFNLLDQEVSYMRAVAGCPPGDNQTRKRCPTPDKGEDEQAEKDKEELIEYDPPSQL